MKKAVLCIVILLAATGVFAQEFIVLVAPFEVQTGFSRSDAETITELFLTELAKFRTIKVVDQSQEVFKEIARRIRFEMSDWSNPNKVAELYQALNANAFVRGQMMTLGNQRIITARIIDVRTTQVLATSRMEINNTGEVLGKLPAFTKEIVNNLITPSNPFAGTWRSTITSNGLTLICILIFDNRGQITVERYDTNIVTRGLGGMRYTNDPKRGYGNGTYSFRENGNRITVDISLTISGVSHEFVAVTANGSFSANSPNQFTVNSMQCEYLREGNDRYISDSYKTFNKM